MMKWRLAPLNGIQSSQKTAKNLLQEMKNCLRAFCPVFLSLKRSTHNMSACLTLVFSIHIVTLVCKG